MKLDFYDLPPLVEDCVRCWTDRDGNRWSREEERTRCDCMDHRRPTEFGQAVLGLIKKFLSSAKCE